ncbi:MAG: hypothetical protein WAW88_16605, partial [Nocardioides sp.]
MASQEDDIGPEEDPEADTEAQWREIVANFGEAPSLPELPVVPAPAWDEPDPEPASPEPIWFEDAEGYHPPPPPPIPRPAPLRLAAWISAVCGPFLLLGLAIFRIGIPRVLVYAALVAILGSFVYLLLTASPE